MSENKALARAVAPTETITIDQAQDLAERIAKSALVPADLRAKPADLLVVLLTGRELGLPPMAAIRGVHVIKGKPALSAQLLVALCQRAPMCRFFRCVESTTKSATWETHREGEPEPQRATWTIAQAQAAGLVASNAMWTKYPAEMVKWRAAATLARQAYADVVLGLYTPEELGDQEEPERAPAPAVAVRVEASPAPAQPEYTPRESLALPAPAERVEVAPPPAPEPVEREPGSDDGDEPAPAPASPPPAPGEMSAQEKAEALALEGAAALEEKLSKAKTWADFQEVVTDISKAAVDVRSNLKLRAAYRKKAAEMEPLNPASKSKGSA